MPTIRFIRTTHENGQFSSFPPDDHPFWRQQGVTVGEVLRPESALTLAELAAACQRHTPRRVSPASLLQPGENCLAWEIGHMARTGVVVMIAGDRGRG